MIIRSVLSHLLRAAAPIIIEGVYGGFWNFRTRKLEAIRGNGILKRWYESYLERFGCYIGRNARFASAPILPHDMFGIFISDMSKIGKNCVIYHQVTIGSNTLNGHIKAGAPTIGNNVYIGAGAKIIGNVTVGDNCRIGANCVVVKDMPPNTTAVCAATRFIESDKILDNTFVRPKEFMRKVQQ